MPKLPDPSLTTKRTPQPGGPAGFINNQEIRSFGADTSIGNALLGIGEEAQRFALREKARLDEVAVDDAKNQYLQEAINLESEYGQIKGRYAIEQDLVKDYTTKLNGINEKISSGFKNESQKKAWESYFGKARAQFTAGILKHKLNESDEYSKETYLATNATRTQVAHSNWSDQEAVNSSASDIVRNIAKEKARAGWGDERTEVELKNALGPLWSGVAAQYINAKQYGMAKKILDQNKDVIGVDKYTSYHKAIQQSELIDLSQDHFNKIVSAGMSDSEQRKAARAIGGDLGDETLKRIKEYQNEQRIERQERERIQSENDMQWKSSFEVEAISRGTLTIDQVEKSGLSDKEKAVWKMKVFEQGKDQKKTDIAGQNKNTYAEWLIKLNTPQDKEITPQDIAKDVNPNGGGLTGEQFKTLLSELESNKITSPKTSAGEAATRGKAQLKSMYKRGDFGAIKEDELTAKETESWKTYSDILIEYQQKIMEEPTVDHTDWLNNRIETEGTRILYKKLDEDFSLFGIGNESDEIISDWLKQKGKAVSPKNIMAVKQRYQTRKK